MYARCWDYSSQVFFCIVWILLHSIISGAIQQPSNACQKWVTTLLRRNKTATAGILEGRWNGTQAIKRDHFPSRIPH
jgi:hypothetical protein